MTAFSAARPGTRPSARPPILLVVAATALLGLALWTLVNELGAYIDAGGTDAAFFERLSQSPPAQPISLSSTEAVLMRCESVLNAPAASRVNEADRIFVALHCRNFVQGALERMPSYAYGWYAMSWFSFLLADDAPALAALKQSQTSGRSEQWLAERRVQLAETFLGALDPSTLAGHETDLALLAQSNRGVRAIARRYVENADFRERITAIVQTLPAADQARFVAMVRTAARELTSQWDSR